MTTAVVKAEKNLMTGGRKATNGELAKHVHSCGHECNSSYCEDPRETPCENCGGPPHIAPGREPWRGR